MAQVAVGPGREENIGRDLRLMTDAAGATAQLLVFPEMSFGRSSAVAPYGQVVGRTSEDEPALSLVDLDLDLVEQARRDMPFCGIAGQRCMAAWLSYLQVGDAARGAPQTVDDGHHVLIFRQGPAG